MRVGASVLRTVLLVSGLLSIGTTGLACESPEDRRDRVIEEARACEEGDTCVLAGGNDCRCSVPVNADAAEEVDAAADAMSCCDLFGSCVAVDCAATVDVRCEDGACVGTQE